MADRPKEPATAPQAEQWYPIVLGSSFKDQSKHFYSLRYEFKPASIDTTKPGAMHKGAENKVTVELSNNQPGKPKVVFQGISEDCKDLDAILFFDGKTLRLERMHRAVKTLRHLRAGETSSSLAAANPAGDNNNRSPFHLNGEETNAHRVPREHVEEIVIGSQPESASRKNEKKAGDNNNSKKALSKASPAKSSPPERKKSPAQYSPPERKRTSPPIDEQLDSKRFKAQDNYFYQNSNNNDNVEHIDVNIDDEPAGAEHESDYELEDIDVSDEEEGQVKETAEPSSAGNELNNSSKPASSSSSGSQSSSSGSSESDGGSSDGSDDESASLGEI